MKNSTLYRSNLSNESIAFLSELKAEREKLAEDINTPKTYKRQGKQKELDVLWQNFKINQKDEKSPGLYLLTGFIAGALCMFIMTAIFSMVSNPKNNSESEILGQPKVEQTLERKEKLPIVSILSSDSSKTSETVKTEEYTVKSGDTLESIIIRFYGKYDLDKVEKIRVANEMSNPNKLAIGQKLIIPIE